MADKERITGFGGFFFRAKEPAILAAWYDDNFGIDLVPQDYDTQPWLQNEGPTVFAPFSHDTTYFGEDTSKTFMLNFRVADLDAMIARLEDAEIAVETRPEAWDSTIGRFARIHAPDGNPVSIGRDPAARAATAG